MAKRQKPSTTSTEAEKPAARKRRRSSRAVGLAGFDFKALNQRYVQSETPVNDAASYGVAIQPAPAPAGTVCWRAIGIHHLTPDENRSRHNIFVEALDESGKRVKGIPVSWTWEGNNAAPQTKTLDKPAAEPGTDIPISSGIFQLWVADNQPSDKVTGIHFNHADERGSNNEIFNSTGHHSFYVVFQRSTREEEPAIPGGVVDEEEPTAPIVTPVEPKPAGRIRARQKLGIDANRPINPHDGKIAPQVENPAVIADTGAGWVRINFVLGQPWSSPADLHAPNGLTWAETYRKIINGFRGRGLRIYGLISDEAMREHPGDQFRAPVSDTLANGWISRYAETFVQIVELFHQDVEVFESYNEPDDWHGASADWPHPNWIHPTWFAAILQAVHNRVRTHPDPSVRGVRLVSGPLQGLDINGNAGARYLRSTLRAGKVQFGWGHNSVPYPFDGIGYHLYIAQKPNISNDTIRADYQRYIDELRQVMRDEMGSEKPIYLSEYGWEDSALGAQRQAECMDLGLRMALQDPAVALGIWFCTQDFEKKFGLYRIGALDSGNRKPVYDAFKSLCSEEIDVATVPPEIAPSVVLWSGIVTAAELKVRSGPGIGHAVLSSLSHRSPVQVLGEIGDWLEIAWPNTRGFIHRDFVARREGTHPSGAAGDKLVAPPGADWITQRIAEAWNRYRTLLVDESTKLGIDAGVAVAVLMAESGGIAYGADGRMIIRFENHIFDSEWGQVPDNAARFRQHFAYVDSWKGHQWRPDPSAPWQECHTSQQKEWLVFDFARQLDETAAMRSISMGATQIMGFNHAEVGYPSVQAMFNAFQNNETAQIRAFFRFVESKELVQAIQRGNYHAFAAGYNGSGQAEAYTRIIQSNLAAYQALTGADSRDLRLTSTQVTPLTVDPALAAAWRAQLHSGLASAKQVIDSVLDAVQRSGIDEGIRLAQLSLILNSYWGQLIFHSDAGQVQQAGVGATHQLGSLLSSRGADAAVSSTLPPASRPDEGNPNGRKLALCIGIDDYEQSPLDGCVADALLWKQTLTRHGFEEPLLMTNQQATRNAILDAISQLVAGSRPGDIVVIQYAGHGTQLDDFDADEVDGDTPEQDEAIVPFDFQTGAYVLDDELSAIFATIPDGVNVTCFFDCCHSGSLSREIVVEGEKSRFIEASPAMQEAHRRYRRSIGSTRSTTRRDIESMREVVFSACQSDELAWESSGHGEFTVHAIKLLSNDSARLNHESFIQQVIAAFGPEPRQNPLLECSSSARARPLFDPIAI